MAASSGLVTTPQDLAKHFRDLHECLKNVERLDSPFEPIRKRALNDIWNAVMQALPDHPHAGSGFRSSRDAATLVSPLLAEVRDQICGLDPDPNSPLNRITRAIRKTDAMAQEPEHTTATDETLVNNLVRGVAREFPEGTADRDAFQDFKLFPQAEKLRIARIQSKPSRHAAMGTSHIAGWFVRLAW